MESLSPLSRPGRAVGHTVIDLDWIDSTNTECLRRGADGAPGGLVVMAKGQTAGRGRRGRSFQSLEGKGLYLSALLRPERAFSEVAQLTAWTAVAVCRAVEGLTGLSPAIKWPNDVLLDGKKLCGILTEAGETDSAGTVKTLVVGIGVNLGQSEEDFGPELAGIATSLSQHLPKAPAREEMADALLEELDRLWRVFPAAKGEYLAAYRARCATLGRAVRILRPDGEWEGQAVGLGEDFSLRVRFADGQEEDLTAGEVSVRGLLGYQ